MKKLSIGIILLLNLLETRAQYSKHIVQFADKNGTPYSFNSPSAFLSTKAIERRNRYNIALDSTDFPVNANYIDSLRNAGLFGG